jgi:EAL and modified HD-GYP domain-containing signal transduction protein
MSIVVGRQPILDRFNRTVAYELLFRSGTENRYEGQDGGLATQTVINNTFLEIGCDRVLGSKRGFINFTRDLLVNDKYLLLPRDRTVIEVLESVSPDETVLEACSRLKKAGYSIALDDVTDERAVSPLIGLADYVKIDLPSLGLRARRRLCEYFRRRGLRIVAEKVETAQDLDAALRDGCELFQGYFFARPEMISSGRIPSSKMACLRLISEIQREDLDFDRLEKIVRLDIALTRRLLCFVNSAAFPVRRHVEGIRQALLCLGEKNIRRWVSVAALPGLAADRPSELLTASLVRARFCELAAEHIGQQHRSARFFLVGLLSLLDAMVGRPLNELLVEMGLEKQVGEVILNVPGADESLRTIFDLAGAFERSNMDDAARLAAKAGVGVTTASNWHMQAIGWADSLSD